MTGAEQDWRDREACSSASPDLFFPAGEDGPAYEAQVAAAKAVCARCPVRAECLAEALVRIPYGIAGGLTPEDRRRLPRRPRGTDVEVEGRTRLAASRAEAAAAGVALLAAGRPARSVAQLCGVTERTVTRWAARARTRDGVST
jgi:hypothetical protein